MDKEQQLASLWRHLMDMNRQIKLTIRNMSVNANISCSGVSVIFQLEHQPQMKMNDIADHLSITLGAATSLVDKLEEQRWVERARCTQDRRIIYVQLTEEGKKKMLEMREHFSKQAQSIFAPLSSAELTQFTDRLKVLEQYLSDYNLLLEQTK